MSPIRGLIYTIAPAVSLIEAANRLLVIRKLSDLSEQEVPARIPMNTNKTIDFIALMLFKNMSGFGLFEERGVTNTSPAPET